MGKQFLPYCWLLTSIFVITAATHSRDGEAESSTYSSSKNISYFKKAASKKGKLIEKFVTVDCLDEQTPGKLSASLLFTPYTTILKRVQKQAKQRFGSVKAAPLSLQNKRAKLKAILQSTICEVSPQPTPTPTDELDSTPTPTPTGTPSPTPTGDPHFDEFGNVTAAGKLAFDIPSDLEANIGEGETKYTHLCQDCHEPRGLFYHFLDLRDLTLNTMGIPLEDLPDDDLADIVAFLNRLDV